MTIEEYGNLLFDAGYLLNSPESRQLGDEEYNIYQFTEKDLKNLKKNSLVMMLNNGNMD